MLARRITRSVNARKIEMNKNVFAELTESIKEAGAIRQVNGNIQMIGNAALMALPKVAILSSRRVAPAAVMRCYD